MDELRAGHFKRCGSPGYVAPEVLKNEGCMENVDIFSCGCILYQLMTGRPLFPSNEDTYADIIKINRDFKTRYIVSSLYRLSSSEKDFLLGLLNERQNARLNAEQAL